MKALILLSGGLDSTVLLAHALKNNRECQVISFDYGQRHRDELDAAKDIAQYYQVSHHCFTIDSSHLKTSALLNPALTVPKDRTPEELSLNNTPNTYVPARNTLFLSFAMGIAENEGIDEIYVGANSMDGAYPDCTPSYFQAFQNLLNTALPKHKVVLCSPFLEINKKEIAALGKQLQVPFNLTFSCYDPPSYRQHCHHCDACLLRQEAL